MSLHEKFPRGQAKAKASKYFSIPLKETLTYVPESYVAMYVCMSLHNYVRTSKNHLTLKHHQSH